MKLSKDIHNAIISHVSDLETIATLRLVSKSFKRLTDRWFYYYTWSKHTANIDAILCLSEHGMLTYQMIDDVFQTFNAAQDPVLLRALISVNPECINEYEYAWLRYKFGRPINSIVSAGAFYTPDWEFNNIYEYSLYFYATYRDATEFHEFVQTNQINNFNKIVKVAMTIALYNHNKSVVVYIGDNYPHVYDRLDIVSVAEAFNNIGILEHIRNKITPLEHQYKCYAAAYSHCPIHILRRLPRVPYLSAKRGLDKCIKQYDSQLANVNYFMTQYHRDVFEYGDFKYFLNMCCKEHNMRCYNAILVWVFKCATEYNYTPQFPVKFTTIAISEDIKTAATICKYCATRPSLHKHIRALHRKAEKYRSIKLRLRIQRDYNSIINAEFTFMEACITGNIKLVKQMYNNRTLRYNKELFARIYRESPQYIIDYLNN